MSAYICDRDHILFLVTAAMSRRLNQHGGLFRWHYDNPGRCGELAASDYARGAEVANMLYRENIRSVSYRYPGDKTSATLPGPVGGNFIFTARDMCHCNVENNPIQVLKSISCYEYQTCEHPEWEASEARAFCRALQSHAIHALPGYDEAEWGAPAKRKLSRTA